MAGGPETTTCAQCAAQIPAAAKFCQECGSPAALRSCPSCGAPAATGRFCNECGSALTASGAPEPADVVIGPVVQRRVTSVLFGDLVGFTPLSESRDAEEVRELLSAYFALCRTIIDRYGGVVEKFIGDAVMAVWGVPMAHEDDAERAVRAGLELVAAIAGLGEDVAAPGLAMRVGIVTGEVAVTLGATGEGMVAGDAVNTAARVQSAASPGQVWVDETTRSLSAAAISFTDAGEHALKGKSEHLRLWAAGSVVAEVGGGQRVDGLEAPLTGRVRELRLVKELFHAAEETRRPRLVVVDGEAGVGKSRLVWEFEKYIDGLSAPVRWHRGRCLSYGEGVAFWALAEAIRGRLGLVEADTGDTVTHHLEAGLGEFVPEAEERDWLRPRLATLIGAAAPATDPTFAREELFAAWTTFLERVGADGVLVLVIDDAHHADDALLGFVEHLLANARAAIFVLALSRPELLTARPELGGRRASVVRLEPLHDTAMGELVDGLVAGLAPGTRAALVTRAEGIPLFAVETVRALIDRDLIIPFDGRYMAAPGVAVDLDAIGAPASLRALVAARLDALTPSERRVVTDASVLGAVFTRDGLAALAADASGDLDATLDSLQRKEILSIQTDRLSADRGQYRFVQSVLRQVAYATQSRRDRKTRHLAAAAHLASQPDPADDLAALIAQHLLDALDASTTTDQDTPHLTARAQDLLERGAQRARTLGAPTEAQRLLETALVRTQDPADQARLHLAAGEAAADAGEYTDAISHAQWATAWYDEHERPIDAGAAVALHARIIQAWREDNATAIGMAEPRWFALERTPEAAMTQLKLASVLTAAYLAKSENAHGYGDHRIRLAEAIRDYGELSRALAGQGLYYQRIGAPVAASVMYDGALSIVRGNNLVTESAHALMNLGTLQISRNLDAALESGRGASQAARRSGNMELITFADFNYLLALWTAGRLAEARALLEDIRELRADASGREPADFIQTWLDVAEGHANPQHKEEHVGWEASEPEPTDDLIALSWMGNADINRALLAGDTASAARTAQTSLVHLVSASGIEDDFMHLWPPMVLAALEANDVRLAEQLLNPVAVAPPAIVSPAVAAHFQRLSGLVSAARGDDPAKVETHLRAGIEALDTFGAVGICAQAEEELGRWLVQQGRIVEAGLMLEKARSTYREIGANGWLSKLESWQSQHLPLDATGSRQPG